MWHDWFMYVTWLIVSTKWHVWCIHVAWLIVSIYVTWLIHICDVTNCVYICDTTRSHMWRDSLYLYMARPHTHMCTTHITYVFFYPKCFRHAQGGKKKQTREVFIFILNISDSHRGKKKSHAQDLFWSYMFPTRTGFWRECKLIQIPHWKQYVYTRGDNVL